MKVLVTYIRIGLFLILGIPLLVTTFFSSSYIFVQVTAFEIIIMLLLIPALWIWVWDLSLRPRWTLPVLMFSFFIGILVVSGLVGVSPLKSFGGVWYRFGDVIDWIYVYLYVLMLGSFVRSHQLWRWYIRTAVAVSTMVAIIALLQVASVPYVFSTGERVFSTIGNPGFLTAYLILSIGLTLYLFIVEKKQWQIFYGLAAFLQVVIVPFTGSRAGLLGIGSACFLLIILWLYHTIYKNPRHVWRTYVYCISFMVLIGVGIVILSFSSIPIVQRITSTSITEQTVQSRVMNWEIARKGYRERPLFGWGELNYEIVFQRFFNPRLYDGVDASIWFDRSHSEFLDRLVSSGSVGLLVYLLLLTTPFLLMFTKKNKNMATMQLLPFLIGYYVYLFFFFHSIADTLLFVFYIAFMNQQRTDYVNNTRAYLSMPRMVAILAVIVSLGCSFLYFVKPVTASYFVRKGELSDSLPVKIRFFQQAWDLSKPGKRAIVHNLTNTLAQRIILATAEETYISNQLIIWTKEIIRLYPYEASYWLSLSNLYRTLYQDRLDQLENAIHASSAGVALAPSHPFAYRQRGLSYLLYAQTTEATTEQKQYIEYALQDFKHAVQLSPHVYENMVLLLSAEAIRQKNPERLLMYVQTHEVYLHERDWYMVIQTFAFIRNIAVLEQLHDYLETMYRASVEAAGSVPLGQSARVYGAALEYLDDVRDHM